MTEHKIKIECRCGKDLKAIIEDNGIRDIMAILTCDCKETYRIPVKELHKEARPTNMKFPIGGRRKDDAVC